MSNSKTSTRRKRKRRYPMFVEIDVDLESTLGCGQAHRWWKKGDTWEGVLGKDIVVVKQADGGIEFKGTSKKVILDYFRAEDDLEEIYSDISKRDRIVKRLVDEHPGMRLLRQEPWECIASYLLATNANVKRIGQMVDSVCREFGDDLGGRYSFPTPEQIIAGEDRIAVCKLGYRQDRFVELAHRVHDGEINPNALKKLNYDECVQELLEIKGVGNKVADCIALFAYDHLQAFPIDARIERILKETYHKEGSYRDMSAYALKKFGRYAGYAQEFLYCWIDTF